MRHLFQTPRVHEIRDGSMLINRPPRSLHENAHKLNPNR
jgi:hypothetical protein